MSIASEITRLQNAKAALKTQIEAKGVTVDTAATLDAYATYVEEIPTGGGDENRLNLLLTDSLTALTSSDLSGVSRISDYLCQYKTNLTTVNAPDVATYGSYSFAGCSALTGVSFSNYQNITIGSYAFDSFTYKNKIKDITINRVVEVGDYAFRNCTNLTSCTFTETVNSTSKTLKTGAFSGCTGLSSLVLPFNILAGNEIFRGCTNLTGITFVDNVSYVGQSSWSSSNIFSGCTNLEYLDFTHNIQVPTVGAPANSFNGLPATTEIRVPQSLYDAWTASTQWSAVTSQIVAYPDIYNTYNLYYTTNNDSAITPNKAYSVSTWGSSVAKEEYDLTTGGTVTFYGPNLKIPTEAYRNKTALVNINIPNGVETIGDHSFRSSGLSGVTIPSSVTGIGEYAFYEAHLQDLVIPDGVTTIPGRLLKGTELTAITIGSGVTTIKSDVFYCQNLTSITIKATTPPQAETYAFNNIASTGTIYVPAAALTTYQEWAAGITFLGNWTITAITE